MKIGILDGNPNILASVADTLQISGHTVYMHTAGASLLEALFPPARRDDPLPYDLVLLDLLLPGTMSGKEEQHVLN